MAGPRDDLRDVLDALRAATGNAEPCPATGLVGEWHKPGFIVRGCWSSVFNKHADDAVVFAPGGEGTKLGPASALHVATVRRVMARMERTMELHPYLERGWVHGRHCLLLEHGPEPCGEGRDRLTMRKLFKLALMSMSLLQDDSHDSYHLDEQVAWVCGLFLQLLDLLRPDVTDVHAWMQEQCEFAAGRRAPVLESRLELDLPCAMEHMLETGDTPNALFPTVKPQAPPRPASSLLAPPPSPAAQPLPSPVRAHGRDRVRGQRAPR